MFKSFRQIFTEMSQTLSAAGAAARDFRPGSLLGALMTAIAACLSMGWLDLSALLQLFYVNSSYGDYLRRRVGDLGMTVGQGTFATGSVIITPANNSVTGTIPAGTLLSANGLLFSTNADCTIGSPYNTTGLTSLTVGSVNNLNSGVTLTPVNGGYTNVSFQIGSSLDTNGIAQGNLGLGSDPESDPEIKLRFPQYLLSLSRCTVPAITQALLGTTGVNNLVLQNNTPAPGWLTISVSSTTSLVPQTVQDAVAATMDAWVAAGIAYILKAVLKRSITVNVTVGTTDPTASVATIRAQVSSAIIALTQTLVVGRSIYAADIARAGYLSTLSSFMVTSPDAIAASTDILSIDTVNVSVLFQ